MKRILFLLLLIPSIFTQAQQRCASFEYEQQLLSENPEYIESRIQSKKAIDSYIANRLSNKNAQAVEIIVPVVVHILHNNPDGSIGGNNISEEQIQSQLDRLNADFSGLNVELEEVPEPFDAVRAFGTGISFCLATVDPNGVESNGITRTYTINEAFTSTAHGIKSELTGGKSPWPPCDYLNIWVAPRIETGAGDEVLGYAQSPGLNPNKDGIVVGNRYFGDDTGTAVKGVPPNVNNYYKGRTLVHEAGHYFGLKHIWGDDGGTCNGTDHIEDTPNQAGPTSGCPGISNTCDSQDMIMNFLDYTYDECMSMFSMGQVLRMEATLNTEPDRNCLFSAFENSCASGCLAELGELEAPMDSLLCLNEMSDSFKVTGGVTYPGYETVFLVSHVDNFGLIRKVSDGPNIDFNNLPVGTYSVHPVSFKVGLGFMESIEINNTTLNGLINKIETDGLCADLLTENAPTLRVMEKLDLEFEVECNLDALGEQTGSAMLNVVVNGGSGNYEFNGPGNGDRVEHGESFAVRVEDVEGCIAQKIGSVDCPKFEHEVEGFNFINNPATFVLNEFMVNFNSPNEIPIEASIYSISGQKVYRDQLNIREGVNLLQLDTSTLPPGIYILVLDNQNERLTKKFEKVRR